MKEFKIKRKVEKWHLFINRYNSVNVVLVYSDYKQMQLHEELRHEGGMKRNVVCERDGKSDTIWKDLMIAPSFHSL